MEWTIGTTTWREEIMRTLKEMAGNEFGTHV